MTWRCGGIIQQTYSLRDVSKILYIQCGEEPSGPKQQITTTILLRCRLTQLSLTQLSRWFYRVVRSFSQQHGETWHHSHKFKIATAPPSTSWQVSPSNHGHTIEGAGLSSSHIALPERRGPSIVPPNDRHQRKASPPDRGRKRRIPSCPRQACRRQPPPTPQVSAVGARRRRTNRSERESRPREEEDEHRRGSSSALSNEEERVERIHARRRGRPAHGRAVAQAPRVGRRGERARGRRARVQTRRLFLRGIYGADHHDP